MKTIEINLYQFNELSESAKETAIDWYRSGNLGYNWWEFAYDDAKEIASLFGLEIDRIYFSGFWSQGDGACLTGHYKYQKGGLRAVKEHAPLDKELHRIVEELQEIQRKHFYKLECRVSHNDRYYHARSTDFDFGYDYEPDNETEIIVRDLLRDYMDWIYNNLEKEYEYLQSDEQIIEAIKSNDYDFTIDGKVA